MTGFQIWMLVDAVRREEWLWAVLIFFFGAFSAMLYFFMVYRAAKALDRGPAFEWPGAAERERIKQLEEQIHHLDKAHHHAELGDIYQKQGKLDKAIECYETACERDSEDIDILGPYGQCLIKLKQPEKAVTLLEKVVAENPKHDYGSTMMALAQAYAQLDATDKARVALEKVLETQTYAEARVTLAEIYKKQGMFEEARHQLQEVVEDEKHAPSFVQKKDKVWTRKARQLLDQI
ncbi:MAG: tetratricopeptide repeat protein [Verrucomicrobia bacterium]|nr:tetratricopeptide repeat protein [Verrucomicrobiota bacterium]